MIAEFEREEGVTRVSVSTLLDIVQVAAKKIPGVVNVQMPRNKAGVVVREQPLNASDKVPLEDGVLEINLVLTLREDCQFHQVALEVQKAVFEALRDYFGISPRRVNVGVQEVVWS
ncbi:Asp23/Gls24 family envelope stress response protein [Thermatribacter velox]|uniref:Asp23/Gls24 family envelope stress response protein n=1 Tax=Thermatribacter velox TaxID=3039681 RepID=A0ABZ2YE75_9BACT